MKEKFVMTSLLVGGVADIATTAVGLSQGFQEVGGFGSHAAETGNMNGAYIYRMAVTAILIGIYAYSKENPNRFSYSIDRAARISNLILWGVVALNAVQLAGAMR